MPKFLFKVINRDKIFFYISAFCCKNAWFVINEIDSFKKKQLI